MQPLLSRSSRISFTVNADIDIVRLGHVVRMSEDAPGKKSFQYETGDGSHRRGDQNFDGEIRWKKTSRNLVSEIGEEAQKIEALGSLFYVRPLDTTIYNGHLSK